MTLLVGKPEHIVRDLAHPTRGVTGSCKFLPGFAEIKDWLYGRLGQEAKVREREERLLAPPDPERAPLTEEERERARLAVLAFKQGVKALVDKSTSLKWPNAKDFGWTDEDMAREQARASENLSAMRPKASLDE